VATTRLPRELSPLEIRILGSLLEKQQATPEAYPLTLNSLVLACNQKTGRDPVTDLSPEEVEDALSSLRELVLVWKVTGMRAERWEQNLDAKLTLTARQKAVLSILFLRGPQTAGEIRGRSERLFAFSGVEEVEQVLAEMASGLDPLVVELSRRPGQKETRWAHLAGTLPDEEPAAPEAGTGQPGGSLAGRVLRLEGEVDSLKAELVSLRLRLGD
jgi:uncharacterized protein YceH (UPF0502 family)